MGYRGKLSERQQARQLRRAGLPLAEIASRLGVSKSSVSLWVRDVSFEPRLGRFAAAAALPTPCSGGGRPRSTGWWRRVRSGSGGCRSASSWWRGSRCTRGKEARQTGVKHVHGCATVSYSCSPTHRTIMGLVGALLSGAAIPG